MPDETRAGERQPTRRLFFALWPDATMQSALGEATRAIVSSSDGAPVPPQNFHFTLAFLGSVPESRIADLTPIAARVALAFQDVTRSGRGAEPRAATAATHGARAGVEAAPIGEAPVAITLDRIELWRKSQVLCATSRAQPTHAIALAETVKRALTEHGFAPDLKPFRAHATLARKVRRVTGERTMPPVIWTFREFRLIESRTASSGSLYSTREIYALAADSR
jgi:RNA 2',3'-cyclic 3'-phosphodiesterase